MPSPAQVAESAKRVGESTGKAVGESIAKAVAKSSDGIFKVAKESRGPGEDEYGNRIDYATKRDRAKNAGHEYARSIIDDATRNARPVAKPLSPENVQAAESLKMQKFMNAGIGAQNMLSGGGTGQQLAGAVQIGASGMLGSKVAGLAGGPAGMAVMAAGVIADVVTKAIEKPFSAARRDIAELGETAQKVARNDGLGVVASAARSAGERIEGMGLAGKVAGETLKTAAVAVETFQSTLKSFTDRGRELAGYDARIALANANAQMRRIQSDISEAQRMGARYAALLEKEQKLDQTMRELLMPIKEKIADILLAIIKFVEAFTDWDKFYDMIKLAVLEAMNAFSPFGLLVNLEKIKEQIREEAKKRDAEKQDKEQERGSAMLKDFFQQASRLVLESPKVDPAIAAADRHLRLPAFGGL